MERYTGKTVKAVAVLECFEQIPCNPCTRACPHGAISMEGGIHMLPVLDASKCIGCGICITHCSGQAIFVVDAENETGHVMMPYEMLPMPVKDQIVDATDREGAYVCEAIVTDVREAASFDHTAIVKLEIPAKYIDDVRSFRFRSEVI